MKYSEAGKGSQLRQYANHKAYADNYDRIFGKKVDELDTKGQPPVQHSLVEQENIDSRDQG